jgi:exopolyphosphatase/guanosine-5'-triphosphate,3'-diphosphate pyrophosphatase
MERIAIIDVGSNSARLVITETYNTGAFNMVYNQKEALRLAQKLDKKGAITPQAFAETLDCMHNFASMCKLYKTQKIFAVATAAIRNAANGAELAAAVTKETGIKLQIISGKTEAYMSYLGVINSIAVDNALIFDLGGGSTELILIKNRKLVESISLPIGCVNLTTNLKLRNKLSPETANKLKKAIAAQLNKVPWLKPGNIPLIGVGGTARTVGKIDQKRVKYYTPKIHNYQFAVRDFKATYKYLQGTTLNERKQISGLPSDRTDIIVAGAAIINALADRTKAKRLIVSGCGLREGIFDEYRSRILKRPVITPDILTTSTDDLLHLYSTDIEHSTLVSDYALMLFDAWKPLHNMDESWRPLLRTAALLHDIGIRINYYSHARHSGYMIENSCLFGVDHLKIVYAGIMAAWHNGVSRSYMRSKQYKVLLTDTVLANLSRGALLIAIGEALDYTQSSNLDKVTARIGKTGAILNITSPTTPSIELHQLKILEKWFAKAMGVPLIVKVHK